MRLKTRGLAQHGGLPDRLEESDPPECDIVRDRLSMPPSLTDHTACPGQEVLSCERLAIPATAAAGLLQATDMMEITHDVPRHPAHHVK